MILFVYLRMLTGQKSVYMIALGRFLSKQKRKKLLQLGRLQNTMSTIRMRKSDRNSQCVWIIIQDIKEYVAYIE